MEVVEVQVFPSGPFATNALVVSCGSHAWIIDPAYQSTAPIKEFVQERDLVVEKILLTHSHWDHIADAAESKETFDVPLYVHREDEENLRHPGSDRVPHPLGPIEPVAPDGYLEEGQELVLGDTTFVVLHTPGHSPGLVCLYAKQASVLIVGDLFFRRSIGTLALPTAEPERMWASLERIATLPDETRVYPGHGPETTLGAEGWLKRAKELYSMED